MGIITVAFDDGYKETFESCAEFLAEKGIRATFAVSSSHIGKTLENRDVLNEGEIKYLISNGHEIAAHTLTHRNMLDVFNSQGEKEVKNEMEGSKKRLEETFGIEIKSFVFPFIKNNVAPSQFTATTSRRPSLSKSKASAPVSNAPVSKTLPTYVNPPKPSPLKK